MPKTHYFWSKTHPVAHIHLFCVQTGSPNRVPPFAICITKTILGFPDSGLISGIFSPNFGLKMNYFLTNSPRMIHSYICFHMRWVGASEYHFDAYKCIRMGSNGKNAFSWFFGFPPKNFSSPYLSSPTWHKSHSVLKIIVWISSLLTNIIQYLRKHIKGTRASDVSLIENIENFQILPFWTQKPYFCM